MLKSLLVPSLKVLLAAGIVYFLITSGKLDFNLLLVALKENTLSCIIGYILFIFIILGGALRWNEFLKIDPKYNGNYLQSVKLTYLGLFFNPLLPGAVSGDFIKLYYTYRLNSETDKKHLLSTIFLDRLFGLTALLLLFGVSLIYGLFVSNPILFDSKFLSLILFNSGFLVFAIVLTLAAFKRKSEKNVLINFILHFPIIEGIVSKIIESFDHYKENYRLYFKSLLISLFCQILNILVFYTIVSPYFENPIAINDLILILPAGIIIAALPITPMGIGVGHAIFIYLFSLLGESNGANYYNLYLMILTLTNLTGAFAYLFCFPNFKFHSLDEIQNMFKS